VKEADRLCSPDISKYRNLEVGVWGVITSQKLSPSKVCSRYWYLLKQKVLSQKAMFLMDSATYHPSMQPSSNGLVTVKLLVLIVTSIIQSLDQGVIASMK
jgi:hypothetical protein